MLLLCLSLSTRACEMFVVKIFQRCAGDINSTRVWPGCALCAAKRNLPAEGNTSAAWSTDSQPCVRPKSNVTRKDMPFTNNHSYEQAKDCLPWMQQVGRLYVDIF